MLNSLGLLSQYQAQAGLKIVWYVKAGQEQMSINMVPTSLNRVLILLIEGVAFVAGAEKRISAIPSLEWGNVGSYDCKASITWCDGSDEQLRWIVFAAAPVAFSPIS